MDRGINDAEIAQKIESPPIAIELDVLPKLLHQTIADPHCAIACQGIFVGNEGRKLFLILRGSNGLQFCEQFVHNFSYAVLDSAQEIVESRNCIAGNHSLVHLRVSAS